MKAASFGVAVVLLVLASCSKDETKTDAAKDAGTTKVVSCDRVVAVSTCSEYRVDAAETLAKKAACTKLGGTFVESECPNTSVLGGCVMSMGETRKFYSGGGASYDAARAQKDCTSLFKGSWTAL